MKTTSNYASFVKQFDASITKSIYMPIIFNGYYLNRRYRRRMCKMVKKFKHEILYQLPFERSLDKEVFLNNLRHELILRRETLKRFNAEKRIRSIKHIYIPFRMIELKGFMNILERRIRWKFKRQLKCINRAISIVEQAMSSFGFPIENEEPTNTSHPEISWEGEKLELIQVLNALIKSGYIVHGKMSRNKAIEYIAEILQIELNRNNFSSFSRSIHSNNNDYQPEIFRNIQNSYEKLVVERIENQGKFKKTM